MILRYLNCYNLPMSHNKKRARGQSYYLDRVNPRAARYLNTCAFCGKTGINPTAKNNLSLLLYTELHHL